MIRKAPSSPAHCIFSFRKRISCDNSYIRFQPGISALHQAIWQLSGLQNIWKVETSTVGLVLYMKMC